MLIVVLIAAFLWGMSTGVIMMLVWFKRRDTRLRILTGKDARRFMQNVSENESKAPLADYERAKALFDRMNKNIK